ncbi:hypothetical protein BDV93DRAFT_605457 [Ceratobasidium sp. AG-I]|nr:hypothetical protein BDV93DRAFT_605457 [Ceratobasidium sp. AG-I]
MSPITTAATGSSAVKHAPHKVSLACNFCRARKRKCDGARPVCGYCKTMKNESCKFDVHSDKRKPASRLYVSALESRIKLLEKVIRETPGADLPPETFEVADIEDDCPSSNPEAERRHVCIGCCDTDVAGRLPEDSGASVEAIIDMGRLRLCLSKTDKGDTMNEGDSSNFCYHGSSTPCFPSCMPARLPSVEPKVDLFKDERELALLSRFWMWQDIHFTVVERASFLKAYKDGERDSEWVSPMLVDMMLAVGEQYGYAVRNGEKRVMYAERAAQALVHELARPRMATMLAIQLMAVFDMGCGKIGSGWSLIGLAATLCSRLGLHLDSTELVARGKMKQDTKTVRDIAFWGVFIQDRLFSVIMGVHSIHSRLSLSTRRPPGSISASKLSGLTLAGGEPNEEVPQHALSSGQAAQARLRDLCDIVETILLDIYSYDASRSVMEDYNLVIKNASIMKIYMDDLPTDINAESCTKPGGSLQAVSLHVFINLFVIMVHRPFIGPHRTAPPPSTPSPSRQHTPLSSTTDLAIERYYRSLAFNYCRTAALRIITLIEYIIHSPCSSSAYDIFGACTILLLSPQDPEAMQAVRTGLGYLDQLERSRFWPGGAEDSRRRVWALAKRWNVKPLLEGRGSTESSTSTGSISTNTPPAPVGSTDPWSGFPAVVAWDTLSASGGSPNAFSGPDAALFATYSSAELGTMYGDLGVPTDVVDWDPNSWDFLGLQPGQQGLDLGLGEALR